MYIYIYIIIYLWNIMFRHIFGWSRSLPLFLHHFHCFIISQRDYLYHHLYHSQHQIVSYGKLHAVMGNSVDIGPHIVLFPWCENWGYQLRCPQPHGHWKSLKPRKDAKSKSPAPGLGVYGENPTAEDGFLIQKKRQAFLVWLVVFFTTPLKNDGLRQLGWLATQYMGKF